MDKSKNIRVVNLADYERPTIHEVSNKEWVMYGDNNDYFDVIIERYLGSPTNARCVNGISDMIFGLMNRHAALTVAATKKMR